MMMVFLSILKVTPQMMMVFLSILTADTPAADLSQPQMMIAFLSILTADTLTQQQAADISHSSDDDASCKHFLSPRASHPSFLKVGR